MALRPPLALACPLLSPMSLLRLSPVSRQRLLASPGWRGSLLEVMSALMALLCLPPQPPQPPALLLPRLLLPSPKPKALPKASPWTSWVQQRREAQRRGGQVQVQQR